MRQGEVRSSKKSLRNRQMRFFYSFKVYCIPSVRHIPLKSYYSVFQIGDCRGIFKFCSYEDLRLYTFLVTTGSNRRYVPPPGAVTVFNRTLHRKSIPFTRARLFCPVLLTDTSEFVFFFFSRL